jgi:single-stranded DNA-binding protein
MNGPKPERKEAMSQTAKKFFTVYGNLGAQDPRTHQTNPREREIHRFDPVTEGLKTFTINPQAKTFRTFQIAVNSKDKSVPTRWIPCIDWSDETKLFRSGDRVRIHGYFQLRIFTGQDGHERRVQQLVVVNAGLEKAKIRTDSRAAITEAEEQLAGVLTETQPQEDDDIPF